MASGLIVEHNPVMKSELAELTYVGRLAGHHHLRHFSLQGVDVMGSVGMDISFNLDGICPEWFWCTSTDHFLTSGLLQLSNAGRGSGPKNVIFSNGP